MNWSIGLWSHLLRISFHLLYHQLAPLYDAISWIVSFGQWRVWQTAVLPFIDGEDVLELGHGPGHMLVRLRQQGYRVSGADVSPQMSKLARRRIRSAGIQAAIVQAPAQRLPFAAASYDTVLATFPTEYIAEVETLREVHRVLRETGRLLILPQARLTGDALPVRLLEGLYRITGQRVIPQSADDPAADSPFITTARGRFQECGFEVHMEQVDLPGSEVIILILSKQRAKD
jgi:ubiquinone/menaquinone biosynthesis C-methylase UbiE